MKRILPIFIVIIILIIGVIFCHFVIFGSGSYTTEDIKDYYDFTSHNENGIKSDLYIFPKKVQNVKEEAKYYYSFSDTFLDTTYQIYLDCVYENDEFEKEKNRIESLMYESQKIVFDNENFILPAFVARLGNDCTSEYVLIDEQSKRIIYIYLQFAKKDDIGFDETFLPDGYRSYGECNANYSLY